jgi:hypothetical protein
LKYLEHVKIAMELVLQLKMGLENVLLAMAEVVSKKLRELDRSHNKLLAIVHLVGERAV